MNFLNSNNNLKFDFNDFSLVPEAQVNIESRNSIDIFVAEDYQYRYKNSYPIVVSPMDTIIDITNIDKFSKEFLTLCIPRDNNTLASRILSFAFKRTFISVSLQEFRDIVELPVKAYYLIEGTKILVDIANGHLSELTSLTKKFKKRYISTTLMLGNVANPLTYKILSEAGADYIRCGIGGGSACTTSANTAVHYPVASLIHECYQLKISSGLNAKIVADGGFKNFDDIIKALALGADYVMLGSIMNKTAEACGQAFLFKLFPIGNSKVSEIFTNFRFLKPYVTRKFRGMSTKEVQKSWKKKVIRTSEGVSRYNKVEYTLAQWQENFKDYLQSAMSYTNSLNLKEFRNSNGVFISTNSLLRYKK